MPTKLPTNIIAFINLKREHLSTKKQKQNKIAKTNKCLTLTLLKYKETIKNVNLKRKQLAKMVMLHTYESMQGVHSSLEIEFSYLPTGPQPNASYKNASDPVEIEFAL